MKRKKIIGYKVRIRGDLKIEEDIYIYDCMGNCN